LIIVVAYATVATLFYWSFVDGYLESVVNSHARFIAAPVRVTQESWFEDPDPEHALPSLDFLAEVLALANVKAAAPRLEFAALVRSAYGSEGLTVRGVDPEAERAVSQLPNKVSQGRWVTGRGEVVLGYLAAERLDVRLGERLVLDTAALAGYQAVGLEVVGFIDAGIAGVDQNSVLIHLDDARGLTGVTTATTVALAVPRGQEAAAARDVAPLLPPGVEAYGVWDLIGPIKTDVIGARISAIPIGLLLAAFAAMAVTSTVLVSVLERSRELGVVQALGLRSERLAKMITLEAIISTSLGYGVGLVIGYGVIWIFASYNLIGPLFASAGEAWASAGLAEEFYAALHPIYVLYALATVVLAGLFSLLVPVRHVRRLQPTEAMRAG
jgi:ABC-type lipoprotein release transport system permease subunit